MATRVTVTGPTSAQFNVKLGNEVMKAAAPKISAAKARQLSQLSQAHYRNVVSEVQKFLTSPGRTGIESGGAQTVAVTDPTGSTTSVRTVNWAPLSKAYAKRKPKSTTFWRKRLTGGLLSKFGAMAPPGTESTRARTVSITTTKKSARSLIEVTFSGLPRPMDSYITKSFLDGLKGQTVHDRGYVDADMTRIIGGSGEDVIGRDSLGTFVYVESKRPVISLIASTLGRKLLKVLRLSL
jgi:hypothetical protein